MDLYQAVRERRSVRKYTADPIPQEKLDRIWESVRLAPSACNLQPWRFIILKSKDARSRLQSILQDWVFTAPLLIIGLGNRKLAWSRDGESIHPIDVAIATEHLVLAAAAEGLGTCWICAFDRQALHRALGLSPDWDPVVVTPLGYSNDFTLRTPRKALAEIVQVMRPDVPE
jgi:nitroreductase